MGLVQEVDNFWRSVTYLYKQAMIKQKSAHPNPIQKSTSPTEDPIAVLLIDDQPIVAEAVRRMVAPEPEINFYDCEDATQALQMAMELKPTVILQDLVMPEIDGLMLLRFFRANPATQEIPIIVLSIYEDPQLKAEAFANGANDYLVKLPDRIELIARIRYHSQAYINFLKRHQAELTQQYNKELERRVEERTAELRQALEHLQQTQTQLIQSEKMSSLGQLVAGVAHEINNPVNFIAGNLGYANEYTKQLLELLALYQKYCPNAGAEIEEFEEDIDINFIRQDFPKLIKSMHMGTERIREIVLNLRNFSRLDESDIKQVDIHEGIESTLVILKHRIAAANIELIKNYGNLPKVECYAGTLNQVFMNLIANAIDALAEDRQKPANSNVDLPLSRIEIHTEALSGDRICVRIRDNGPGIPKQVQQRIFDPFFTTKPVGKGTGLGLSISYQIVVDKHRGSLQCNSEPEKGTEFYIEIPTRQQKIREFSPKQLHSHVNEREKYEAIA